MKKKLPEILIICFWLGMMAWLIRFEAFPDYFNRSLAGYKSLLSNDLIVHDSWVAILFKGEPIGYGHTQVEINENNPSRYYQLQSFMELKLTLMGTSHNIQVETTAFLNVLHELQRFSFELNAAEYTAQISAVRVSGQSFRIRTKTGAAQHDATLEIPPDVIIYSPMTEMTIKNLGVGQYTTLRTLDPSSMAITRVTIRALRKETLTHKGQEYKATVLATELHGIQVLSWIDEQGRLLRQETPFGWVLEACTPEEALAILRSKESHHDLLADLAVPCSGTLQFPRTAKEIRLRLRGVTFEENELSSHRQRIESRHEGETIITLMAEQFPDKSSAEQTVPDEEYLSSSPYLPIQHPDILARTRKITGNRSSPEEKARAIFQWVFESVRKNNRVSLPSALDVLQKMEGDCNEHTYLFVALARAAGIPSKIVIGLAYHEGAFYYHAWPAVWLNGRWVEMDPTWGQVTVDATHIALLEGEIASQVQLIKVVGNLKIEILEETAASSSAGQSTEIL